MVPTCTDCAERGVVAMIAAGPKELQQPPAQVVSGYSHRIAFFRTLPSSCAPFDVPGLSVPPSVSSRLDMSLTFRWQTSILLFFAYSYLGCQRRFAEAAEALGGFEIGVSIHSEAPLEDIWKQLSKSGPVLLSG
jgi:hypothetical protein